MINISLRCVACLLFILLSGCSTSSSKQTDLSSAASESWPEFESVQADDFVKNCRKQIKTATKLYEKLSDPSRAYEDRDLMNSINELEITLDDAANLALLYAYNHPEQQVREAGEACEKHLVSFYSEVALSRPLYDKIVQIDKSQLKGVDLRYVEKMQEDFERAGVNKDETTRQRIRAVNDELVDISQEFNRNIRQDVRTVEASIQELRGLPEDFIAKRKVNENGSVTITTDYPDYFPVAQYAQSDDLRKRIYIAFRDRGYPQNKPVLKRLLEKRYELAQLLGFDNYAEYITANKMTGSAQVAGDFIEKINEAAKSRSHQDYRMLLERLQQIEPSAEKVGDWQKTYLENLIRTEVYSVDAQEVRQYFSYGNVRAGIFDLVETLFEVQIKPWETEVWHPSVEAYEIWDGKMLVGQFYLDMHPREGKYKHAAAFDVRRGVKGIRTPIAALVCNFPGDGDPSALMEHNQVETFLHEFGHLLHDIFGGHQPWVSFAGTATERDFVEAPSQMLEEWVWDYETLKTFAKNKSGETIPQALVEKMNRGRNFGIGTHTRHQMFYASVSLNYYNRHPDQVDLDEMFQAMQAQYSPFDYVEGTHMYANFGHLDNYSAMYYTYMWSLVIAADMFSKFEQAGLRNTELAQKYRKTVLEPGGSKDAAKMVEEFLGRPYNFKAFEKMLNRQ